MAKKVLVTAEFTDDLKKNLEEHAPSIIFEFAKGSEVDEDKLSQYDALIGNVAPGILKNMTNLEWIQLNSSGADAYALPGVVPENTVLTCSTGAYGLGISEYMVAMLLNMMKKIPGYLDDQKEELWSDRGAVDSPMGRRVLLVGCGDIGLEFAKRMRAFGCTIVGIRNRVNICPDEIDEIYGVDKLKEEVSKADIIALSLPGTKACYHLFDKNILMACKEGSYLMNVGRGNVIDTAELTKKEIYERFAGIWLDVCETEPLPKGDALYHVPGLLLTPHITGGYHLRQTIENIYNIAVNNLDAWCGNGEYKHLVSRENGYSLK